MKVLISSCLLGNKVRWNKQDKLDCDLLEWANKSGIELVPVCPENELLGTPRDKIRLIQIGDNTCAQYKGVDIMNKLDDKCTTIFQRNPDIVGFIGIHGSPSCGISVGVKNLGRVVKGSMHKLSPVPTVESNALSNRNNREVFLTRLNDLFKLLILYDFKSYEKFSLKEKI